MSHPTAGRRAESVLVYLALLLATAFCLIPILWALVTALKPESAIFHLPPDWFPRPFTTENFRTVLLNSHMPRYLINSALTSIGSVGLSLSVGTIAGYAVARYRFRGRSLSVFVVLAATMIPGIALLVPFYLLSVKLGIHNTYLGLIIVYAASQVPFVLWLMRGFIEAIPQEIEEAAVLDGCSWSQVFLRVVVPLSRSGLAAAAMVVFVWVWNDFILAFTLTSSDNMRLVTNGLYQYVGAYGVEWGKLLAATMVAMLPLVLIFILLERYLVQGLMHGGTKG